VKSKCGEIESRLSACPALNVRLRLTSTDHLEKQLCNLELGTWPPARISAKIPPSRVAKYIRIQDVAVVVGEDIRRLSRFIAANRLAYIKLFKKYRKWTKRDNLQHDFESALSPGSEKFSTVDISPLLNQYSDLLHNIRLSMGVGLDRFDLESTPDDPVHEHSSRSVALRINSTIESHSSAEFDATFAYCPLGVGGSRALYLVHPDQLVEVQVLLLEHSRLAFRDSSSPSFSTPSSPVRSRHNSITRAEDLLERSHDHGFAVIDNADDFVIRQNSIPLDDAEDPYSSPQSLIAAALIWTNTPDVIVCIGENFREDEPSAFCKVQKKHVDKFLDVKETFDKLPSIESTSSEEEIKRSRQWLSTHQYTSPLVCVMSKRNRFAGLQKEKDRGHWCTLDTNVMFKKVSTADFTDRDWPSTITSGCRAFPYAVLEVRQEGDSETNLIDILDKSHLVCSRLQFSQETDVYRPNG
jgi:SPX domain protein involved in polyphosphate accumulation